jgi:mono/diheme cytochrome c family protein
MKRSWILRVVTVGFVSGLLFGTVAQGQAESKAKSGDVARGKTLFARNCASCHGPQGGGDGYRLLGGPDPANLTSPSTTKKSDADLLKTIHDGKPNMPPWKVHLSENQSREVLAYVRTLAK